MLLSDELTQYLYSTVEEFIKNSDNVVIAFSGGIDSSLLAKICKDLDKQVHLVTIGFANSHDIVFSKSISNSLSLSANHIAYEIKEEDILDDVKFVKSKLSCDVLSHIENCIAFYQISKIVKYYELGHSFLTANGFDELFCGYDRYRSFYGNGEDSVATYMQEKLTNEDHMMREISHVISELNMCSYQPFLSRAFIEYAKTIPMEYKIKGQDDLLRKHILREVATRIGVPKEAALHPKKAIQYGSLIHKYLLKNKSVL
ncbi:MAG: asparagine synthase C-terminal domain-containing protein [Candidatus Nitrosocosmicus sp.]|nr:asparagine synthase C-terminal domain-containing protein [Candidatus Nitrosocosmicus sp.]MDN5868795.1 asparagine synthase C-terminal domain-containing protein [Candidatus Nitrosocosmicus sp.]